MDLLTSVVLTIISLRKYTKGSGSDVTAEAIASMVVLVAAVIPYICVVIIITVRVQRQSVLTAIGGLFFFIGDNLPPVIRDYGKKISCDQECVDLIQIVGIIMLGIATVTYIPVLHDSVPIDRETHREEKTGVHIVALLLLAKMTNLNLVYTAIERVTAKRCSEMVTGSAWTYFWVYCIAFLSISVYKMWRYDNKD